MELDQDFNESVQLLLVDNVRVLVIGSNGIAAHGAPCYSATWLRGSGLTVATPMGCSRHSIRLNSDHSASFAMPFSSPILRFSRGAPPHRIDLPTGIDGVNFYHAWSRRVEFLIDGRSVPFIRREDLIANKKVVAQSQDLADSPHSERKLPPHARTCPFSCTE